MHILLTKDEYLKLNPVASGELIRKIEDIVKNTENDEYNNGKNFQKITLIKNLVEEHKKGLEEPSGENLLW